MGLVEDLRTGPYGSNSGMVESWVAYDDWASLTDGIGEAGAIGVTVEGPATSRADERV